ncbi:MAG TPA: YceI family protein, partial [Bacteroidales bacterium]
TMIAQEMKVDLNQSKIQWTGEKVTGEHTGMVDLKDAKLKMQNNTIVEGKFIINMSSLTNTDITDTEYNQKLVGHLKSDDFFSVEKHPTAELVIVESSAFVNNEATVKGNLTIKGITKPIEFKAIKNGNSLDALIIVDRTKYDIRYRSGSFFDGLGDKMIYNDFILKTNLVISES